MNIDLVLKWLHILSSTLLFGTGTGTGTGTGIGIGSAFCLLVSTLRGDARVVAAVARSVVVADWPFTATTAVFQPASGFAMAHLAGMPLSTRWLAWSIGLYVVAIACWLPVVHLQTKLRDSALDAALRGAPLDARYRRLFRAWVALGFPAFFPSSRSST